MKSTIIIFGFLFFHSISNAQFWKIKKQDNIYWFIGPAQERMFFLGVTSVHPHQKGIEPPDFISSDYKNNNIENWILLTSKRVQSYGFHGIGSWSHPALNRIPYTKDLNLSLWTSRHISDPAWEKDVEHAIIQQVRPDDKNLIGYYTDNELNWDNLEKYAEKYFRTIHSLIRKHDPNHLILGVRFNRRPSINVLKASIGYIDAHSFNCYTDGFLWKNMFRETYETTKAPIIISEFSFFADINNSGNPNRFINGRQPFGGQVKNQEERAKMAQKFIESSASCAFIIGLEWFQWNDEPPRGRLDGESYNFGIVDINDKPYILLVEAIKTASMNAQKIHNQSTYEQKGSFWVND